MRLLTFILFFNFLLSYGVGNKPNLLRGCVNFDDSTITVSWSEIEDNCGSFTEARLYANEDNGPFSLIATIPDVSITAYSHYIPNLNTTRKYYLTVLKACNNTDSLTSDTITPDLTYPVNIELDSVSFDFRTQEIIGGWQPNPSNDTRGYQIYDYSSGNGDSIGFTNNTVYIVSPGISKVFPVVLATLDSCDLSSTLSSPHKAMVLKGIVDTCNNTISLNWTRYQGWGLIDSICLYVKTNNGIHKKRNTFIGTITSYIFNDFQLGDTLDLFVRAYTSSGNISSSSNRIAFSTRKLHVPNVFYISNVSVTNNTEVEIDVYLEDYIDQEEILIYKLNPSYDFVLSKKLGVSNQYSYNVLDPNVVVNELSYTYQTKLVNKCKDTVVVSNTAQSILLKLQPSVLYNSYINWLGGVDRYLLQYSNNRSTWNDINSSIDTSVYLSEIKPGCYRIEAHQGPNSLFFNKTSYSNVECVQDSLRVFPTSAINLNTTNNEFVIKGTGIDSKKSSYQIYNRWGEKLVDRNTSSTWNGTYKGEEVPAGLYIYTINIIGFSGEKRIIKGTLYVIK